MKHLRIGFSVLTLAVGLTAFTGSGARAATEQPDVARISVVHGTVDVKRADSGDTVRATMNAPLSVGDYLATHDDARAEVQFGFATAVRVARETKLRFVALDGQHHRVQLAAGTVEVRIARSLRAHPEIETPQATIRPTESGRYRVGVASDGVTSVTVRSGRADVVTDARTAHLEAGATLAIGVLGDPSLRTTVAAADDDFDRWNDERDLASAHANDDAYADDAMAGSDDLDVYGRWIDNARYGRVWSPYERSSWAPYHDGRFVWEPYYGWTWVAAEPWGWAPYHYGNWFYAAGSGWCWYPGAYALEQPFLYRPASVAFFSFGGGGARFGYGNIGWIPLAPYEAFSPWYGGYRNTTVVNNITNVTNVTVINPAPATAQNGNVFTIYHNSTAPGGAVAVQRRAFADGNFAQVTNVARAALVKALTVHGVVPIVPTASNLRYAERPGAISANADVAQHFEHFAPPQVQTRPFAVQQAAIRAATSATPPVLVRPDLTRPYLTHPVVRPVPIDSITTAPVVVHPGMSAPVTREHPVEIVRPASPRDRFGQRPETVAPALGSGAHAETRTEAPPTTVHESRPNSSTSRSTRLP